MSTLAQDVIATRRDTNSTLYHIAVVGMVGSVAASATAFWFLTHEYWAIGEGAMIALTVDYALLRWMKISQRLRSIGAESTSGKVLEWAVGLMTLYLNGSAGLAPLVDPKTASAYVMITVAHLFIPIVLLVLFVAAPSAELFLRHKEQQQREQAEAERNREAEAQRARDVSVQKEREKTTQADHSRRTAEANARAKEADNEARRIAMEAQRIGSLLALSAIYLAKLDNVQAITERARRQLRDRERRQRQRQPGASASPARRQTSSPAVRQGTSPVTQRPNPQDTPDVAALAKVAKLLLENEPGMGRLTLAKELGVTPYYARLVLDHIKAERDAVKDAELTALLKEGGR